MKTNNRIKEIAVYLHIRIINITEINKEYARALLMINAQCTTVITLRKLKSTLSSLKPPIEKGLKSRIVYE